MNSTQDNIASVLTQLRNAFDQTFASTPTHIAKKEYFLVIRIGEDRYGLRLEDVQAFLPPLPCLFFPTSSAAFEGLVSYRGVLFPSYSLAHYLGNSSPAATPLWRVLLRTTPSFALSFANFEGLFSTIYDPTHTPPASVEAKDDIHPLVWKMIWIVKPESQERMRERMYLPVLSISTIFETIRLETSFSSSQEKEESP